MWGLGNWDLGFVIGNVERLSKKYFLSLGYLQIESISLFAPPKPSPWGRVWVGQEGGMLSDCKFF